jgi:hypothetical protein
MYEKRRQQVLPRHVFIARLAKHGVIALMIMTLSLGTGVLGYRFFESMPWIDALLNASMILGGMGPVGELRTVGGKLFASFYALFSGVVFLICMGVMAAPIIHRFLHKFHLDS